MLTRILTAGDSNASTTAINLPPGKATAFFYGTWDTSTLALQYSPDGGTTWVALDSNTANDTFDFTAYSDLKYRATLSSVGASTEVNLAVVQNSYPFNI